MPRKASLLLTFSIPTMLILIAVLGISLLILGHFLSLTVSVNDRGAKANTALYVMLNSNDCTPDTKMAFKDVLAGGVVSGIATGSTGGSDAIYLNYGGKEEGEDPNHIFPPLGVSVAQCLAIYRSRLNLPVPYLFYVSYSGCPGNKCFETSFYPAGDRTLNIESIMSIALPNGDIAKAVFRTRSDAE